MGAATFPLISQGTIGTFREWYQGVWEIWCSQLHRCSVVTLPCLNEYSADITPSLHTGSVAFITLWLIRTHGWDKIHLQPHFYLNQLWLHLMMQSWWQHLSKDRQTYKHLPKLVRNPPPPPPWEFLLTAASPGHTHTSTYGETQWL